MSTDTVFQFTRYAAKAQIACGGRIHRKRAKFMEFLRDARALRADSVPGDSRELS
jgi:hypothetical protein